MTHEPMPDAPDPPPRHAAPPPYAAPPPPYPPPPPPPNAAPPPYPPPPPPNAAPPPYPPPPPPYVPPPPYPTTPYVPPPYQPPPSGHAPEYVPGYPPGPVPPGAGYPPGPPAPPPLPARARNPSDGIGLALVLLGVVLLVLGAGTYLLFGGPAVPPTSRASPSATNGFAVSLAPGATAAATPSNAPATAAPTPATAAPTTATATATATPGPATPAPTTTSEPGPSQPGPGASGLPIDPAVAAQIAQIEQQVAELRGIPPARDVPNRIIDADQLARELHEHFLKENPPADVAAEQELLKRLGLIPQDADLVKLFEELYGSQVAGFYDSETKVFTLVSRGEPFGPADRVIVAHEYDHALQDQRFDLEKIRVTDRAEGDRSLALTALAEGDATLLMTLWAQQNLTPEELAQVTAGGLDADQQAILDRAPIIIKRQLLFPYGEGLQFVLGLFSGSGGFGSIDAAFAAPPTTTEQILHPEKYAAREPGIEIRPADLSPKLGAGWKRSTEQTMGELGIQVWAANGEEATSLLPGLPPLGPVPGAEAAAGWGGDRIASYDGPNGQWAVVWELAWDTVPDVAEFFTAVASVTTVPAPHVAFTEPDRTRVTMVIGSDQETLDQVRAARQP